MSQGIRFAGEGMVIRTYYSFDAVTVNVCIRHKVGEEVTPLFDTIGWDCSKFKSYDKYSRRVNFKEYSTESEMFTAILTKVKKRWWGGIPYGGLRP